MDPQERVELPPAFEDADIDLRPDGTFVSYILVRPTPVHFIEGHWTVDNGYVIATAIVR